VFSTSIPNKVLMVLFMGIETEPKLMFKTKDTSKANSKTTNEIRYVDVVFN
jgi:hypothetical protein